MTFEELENELPNGFHDAQLHSMRTDYVSGSAVLRMALDFGNPDGPKREDYRIGELRVSGLYFCVIDPPDPSYRYVPHGTALNVSGDPAKSDTFPALEGLYRTLPPGVSCYRFFVHEWNSFINIAARDVQVSWIEEGSATTVATS
ncbi:MAG: hypothetical protein LAN83_17790 [Acidobacteriia bacterium]|nr:hypothetical protein [Terriglobia bacterium]